MRMKRKTILKSVVLAALCFGVSGISQAANYESVLIGTEEHDKKVMGDTMTVSGKTATYDFKEDTTIIGRFNWQDMIKEPYKISTGLQGFLGVIQPGGMYSSAYTPKGPHNDMVFNLNGNNMTIYNYTDTGIGKLGVPGQGAYVGTTALWASTPNKIEINDVNKLDCIVNATGYYVTGIYAGYYRGLGSEEKELADRRPGIYIHNKPGWEHAVRCFSDGAQYRENISGIKIFNRGELIVDGYIDFYKQTTDKQGKKVDNYWNLDVNTMGNGWKEYSAHFKVAGGRWGGIYIYGRSLLELNTEMDEKGNVKSLGNEVQMVGDIGYNDGWSKDEGAINLAITGKNSFWRGHGSSKHGLHHLFLSDGGRWEKAGGQIDHFHGGKTEKQSGSILMQSGNIQNSINIDNYEGWTTVLYEHPKDHPANLLSSSTVTIGTAKKGSGIVIQTDAEGIDTENEKAVDGVLEALASRLTYSGYVKGEKNLTGKVKIAEGLTVSSAEKKVGDILFRPATGQGEYQVQTKTDFTTTLTGEMAKDTEYVDAHVLLGEGSFVPKKQGKIQVKEAPAIQTSAGHPLTMTMGALDWEVGSTYTNGGDTINLSGKTGQLTVKANHRFTVESKGAGDLVGIRANEVTGKSKMLPGVDIANKRDNKKIPARDMAISFKGEIEGNGNYTAVRAENEAKVKLVGVLNFDVTKAPGATLLEATGKGNIDVTEFDYNYRVFRQNPGGGPKLEMIKATFDATGFQTNGYLAKATDGGTITFKAANGWIKKGDIFTGETKEHGGTVKLNFGAGMQWHGGVHGEGILDINLDPNSISGDMMSKSFWHNEWQQKEKKGTDSVVSSVSISSVNSKKEGWVHATDSGNIHIQKLKLNTTNVSNKGNLFIYYDHSVQNPDTFTSGDIVIEALESKKTDGQLRVHVRTDTQGMDLTNEKEIDKVYTNLAKKLVFPDAAKEDGIVYGTVGFAEDVYADTKTKMKFVKNIRFDETGRGFYAAQTGKDFTTSVTGGDDKPYADSNVKLKNSYLFNKDSSITIDGKNENAAIHLEKGKKIDLVSESVHLDLHVKGESNETDMTGILAEKESELNFLSGNVTIDVQGKGHVYGIRATGSEEKSSTIKINGSGTQADFNYDNILKIKGTSGKKDGFTAVSADRRAKIGIESRMQISEKGGTIFFADHNGDIQTLMGQTATDPFAEVYGSTLEMKGGILAKAGNGGNITIKTPHLGSSLIGDVYTDIAGKAGTVSIDLGNHGVWKGSVAGTGNLSLKISGKSQAKLVGKDVDYTYRHKGIWINQWEAGTGDSVISEVTGGNNNEEGVIYQKSSTSLTINKIQNRVQLFYDHDKQNPEKIIGGDLIVNDGEKINGKEAALQILTFAEGVNYKNNLELAKVYNALANKVYFYGDKNNLHISVGIKDDLYGPSSLFQIGEKEFISPSTINFNSKTGQGYYYYEAPEQIANAFTTTLTGHNQVKDTNKMTNTADYQYAQGGVIDKETGAYEFKTKGNTVANTIYVGDKNTITYGEAATPETATAAIAAQDLDITLSAENTLDIKAKAETDKQNAIGIYTGKDKTLTLTADDLVITAQAEKGKAYGIYNEGTLTHKGKLTVKEADTALWNKQGTVTLDTANMTANENGIIGEQGTTTSVHNLSLRMKDHKTAVETKGGIITIAKEENKPGNVDLKGDILLNGKGIVDLTLKGQGNNWEGTLKNSDGTMNLTLQDNGVWNNKNDMREDGTYINKLVGAKDKQKAGTIIQNNPGDMIIDNYQGHTKVLYAHDKENPKTVIGGNIIINAAEKESGITLLTDRENIGLGNDAITPVLEALANKLTYKDAVQNKDNLKGEVGLTESLTESSAIIKLSDLEFDKNGKGHLKGNIYDVYEDGTKEVHTGDIVYGNKQTAMMRGAKSAMLATSMIWRATNNDVQKRMGDLRQGTENETGAWGRIGGGKMTFDKDGGQFKTTFTDYMAGYDKQIGKDKTTRAGIAVGYIRGNDSYEKGTGKSHLTTINLYTTKTNGDGTYFDIIARAGKLKNKYTVYNDYGKTLKGDYKTNGYSLSLEYGKRIEKEDGKYIEPSAELTWGRIEGKTYEAHSDYAGGTTLAIDQEAYDSLIGRIGMKAGIRKQNKSAYIGLSLEHEFQGDFDTGYKTAGEKAKTTHMNLKGTWLNISLGGTYTLAEDRYIYGTVEKDFGGDIQTDWRINAGMRLRF